MRARFFSFIGMILLGSLSGVSVAASLEECISVEGREIPHFDYAARPSGTHKRILVIGGIHGDEPEARHLVELWKERLDRIKTPSNYWRVVPLANPDGAIHNTRFNANKVDLNRNFPTKDWDEKALGHWKNILKSEPRRFPGPSAGSEVETKCLMKQIDDFKPDIVVSIHTPYGQMDYDGDSKRKIGTKLLPWRRIGTFTGSLGRYLWDERQIPVLTIELKTSSLKTHQAGFISLQDEVSDLLLPSP